MIPRLIHDSAQEGSIPPETNFLLGKTSVSQYICLLLCIITNTYLLSCILIYYIDLYMYVDYRMIAIYYSYLQSIKTWSSPSKALYPYILIHITLLPLLPAVT